MRVTPLTLLLAGLAAAQPYLPVPANLKVEGIPPLPLSVLERAARYNESRSASLQDWHPVRREILITTRFGEAAQVHRVAAPGAARTQLTFYNDPVAAASYQPKTGEGFVFSKDVGGGEFYQLHSYDTRTGDATLLTDGRSRNGSPQWSGDGRRLAYYSTRRNGRDTDLYVVEAPDPKTTRRLLEVSGGGWAPLEWSPDDRKILMMEYISIHQSALHLVEASSGAVELLTPKNQHVSYDDGLFSRDGKGLYLTTDRDSEFRRLAWMDLATRQVTVLRPEIQWDARQLALSPDGRWLAYVVNEDGSETLHVMDTRTRKDLALPRLPLGVITTPRWHSNSREVAFSLGSARSPSDVYSIDVEKRALERWTASETGGLNPESFAEPERIRWKSFDGRMISGFLYSPPARFDRPRPVIINIHGGPEGQSQPTFLGRTNYYINELGVAVIYPNVRGSSGYGKTFLGLDNGMKREDSVKDIGALLDWIDARSDLDPKRVLVTGGSYGGYMTLASAVHYNDRLCCAVDVVGISNFITLLERTESYRRDLRRVEYGDERDPKMRDFFATIAPLNHAHRITRPLFVIAGRNDPRVPASEGEQMVAAVRKSGAPVWYLVAEDEGHGFRKQKNLEFQFAATVLFVQQHLLGRTAEAGFTPLFNGKDLDGWEVDTPGLWQVRDGVIVGKHNGLKYNDFLRTKKHYSDFELRLKFRLVGGAGNSGIQFRTRAIPDSHEVSGYQADIGQNYWGSLYDESRRRKVLAQAPAESLANLNKDGWNDYGITARGSHITLELNGVKTVDYREIEAGIDPTGFIALQVHGGPPMEVHFKDLRIR